MNYALIAVTTMILTGSAGVVRPAQAIECPLPQHASGAKAVLMPPSQMKQFGQRLVDDPSGNAIPEVAAELRSKYPSLSVDEIVDVLAGAYCTGIAHEGYDDARAREKVRTFAERALDRLVK